MFVFRYLQTIGSKYTVLVSNMKLYFLSYLLFQTYVILTGIVPMTRQLWSSDKLKAAIRDVDPIVYEVIRDEKVIIGFNTMAEKYYYIPLYVGTIGLIFSAVLIVFCTILTYMSLRKNSRNLQHKTRQLYIKLLLILIVECLIGGYLNRRIV